MFFTDDAYFEQSKIKNETKERQKCKGYRCLIIDCFFKYSGVEEQNKTPQQATHRKQGYMFYLKSSEVALLTLRGRRSKGIVLT